MRPGAIEGANVTLKSGNPEVAELHALRQGNYTVTAWIPSYDELVSLVNGGSVLLFLRTENCQADMFIGVRP